MFEQCAPVDLQTILGHLSSLTIIAASFTHTFPSNTTDPAVADSPYP